MTTTDANKSAPKPGFFSIYKPGQGKFVRWGTVAAAALLIGLAMYWSFSLVRAIARGDSNDTVGWIVAGSIGAIGGLLVFMAVARPRPAEFMIMTESEMRKVTWPTRQTVVNSTKIVIVLTLVLASILAAVDALFAYLFHWLEIL